MDDNDDFGVKARLYAEAKSSKMLGTARCAITVFAPPSLPTSKPSLISLLSVSQAYLYQPHLRVSVSVS